nr:snRNA-activating protein complex subunit isoform X1 [Ipomoea batatas]
MGTASLDFDVGGDDPNVSIPRGGPIYVPDMVSALTRIPDFESSVFHELQLLLLGFPFCLISGAFVLGLIEGKKLSFPLFYLASLYFYTPLEAIVALLNIE